MKLVEAYNNEYGELSIQHLVPYIKDFELERSFSIVPTALLKMDFVMLNKKYEMTRVIEVLKKLRSFEFKGTKISDLDYRGISVDMSYSGDVTMIVTYKQAYRINANGSTFDNSILGTPTTTHVGHDTIWTSLNHLDTQRASSNISDQLREIQRQRGN